MYALKSDRRIEKRDRVSKKTVLSDRKKSARKLHHLVVVVTQDRAARIFPQIFGKVLYGLITKAGQ
jgi:hypothetical protein